MQNEPSPAPVEGPNAFEIGVYTFGERTAAEGAETISTAERYDRLLEEAELADQVGLDVFGVGEHHRADFVVSAPAVVLAAIASRTKRIRLASAVTVLSSDDPVRVFQDFATLDLVSRGRAEIIAGRGSFIESFPLFGYDLRDYDALFAEKLDLLLRIRDSERVTWSGRHRPPLHDQEVHPRPVQGKLPIWVAVGGTPASAERAGRMGLPLALAIIGGMPEHFVPLVEHYRESAQRAGHDAASLPVSINGHGFLATDGAAAADLFFPPYAAAMGRIGRERGWPPLGRAHYEALRAPRGALAVGTPDDVIEKILFHHELFGHTRFTLQLSVGTMPHRAVLRAIELLGSEVAPVVRAEIARRAVGLNAPSRAGSRSDRGSG